MNLELRCVAYLINLKGVKFMDSRIVFPGEFERLINRWVNRKRHNGQDNHPNQCMLNSQQIFTIISILAFRSRIKHAISYTDFSIHLPNHSVVELSGADITSLFSEADHLSWKNLLNKIDTCKILPLDKITTISKVVPASKHHAITKEELDEIGHRIQVKLNIYD